MTRIGWSIRICSHVAHALQLLLQTLQGPNVYRIVVLVKNLDAYGRLCLGRKHRVCDVTKLSQPGNPLVSRRRTCESAGRCNGKVVRDIFAQLLAMFGQRQSGSDSDGIAHLIILASLRTTALDRIVSAIENERCDLHLSKTFRINLSCRAV